MQARGHANGIVWFNKKKPSFVFAAYSMIQQFPMRNHYADKIIFCWLKGATCGPWNMWQNLKKKANWLCLLMFQFLNMLFSYGMCLMVD